MRVATLQFNPRLGHVGANIQRADELLAAAAAAGQLRDVQVLVAPEMALTGEAAVFSPLLFHFLCCFAFCVWRFSILFSADLLVLFYNFGL